MDPVELFKKTLICFLESKGRGTQRRVAEAIDIPSSLMNDFLKGRRPVSEVKRSAIAEYFGFKYEDFISFGRCLFETDKPYFWALRSIYIDSNRLAEVASDAGVSPSDIEYQLKNCFGKEFPSDLLKKICAALIIPPEKFKEIGQQEMIKQPKMKWDLWSQEAQQSFNNLQKVVSSINLPQIKEQAMSEFDKIKELLEGFKSEIKNEVSTLRLTFENELLKEKARHAEQMLDLFKELNSLKTICQTQQTQVPQPQQTKAEDADLKKSAS